MCSGVLFQNLVHFKIAHLSSIGAHSGMPQICELQSLRLDKSDNIRTLSTFPLVDNCVDFILSI